MSYTHTSHIHPSTFVHDAFMKAHFIIEQNILTWLLQAFASSSLPTRHKP